MKNPLVAALAAVLGIIVAQGCIPKPLTPLTDQNSNLTQGQVQMTLKVGETTKSEVLETFGSPNITTRDGSGNEVWTYQRSAQVAQASAQEGGWTVIFGGKAGSASGFESSSRMLTLIIKFDKNDVVTDFRNRTSTF